MERVQNGVDGEWLVMELLQLAAAGSSARHAAEAMNGNEMKSEDEEVENTGEKRENGGREAVLAMLGDIYSCTGNLKARQSKLEWLCSKVEENNRITSRY